MKKLLPILIALFVLALYALMVSTRTVEIVNAKTIPLGYQVADESQTERAVWATVTTKLTTITAYSELDSCHHRVRNGCLTASGVIANENNPPFP